MIGKAARAHIAVIGGILLVLLVASAGCSTRNESAPAAATMTPAATVPLTVTSAAPVETTIIPVTTTPQPYQVYTDPTYPLTMDYPEGWVFNQPGNFSIEDYGKMTRNIANFYSPNATIATYRIFSVDVDPSAGSDLGDYFNHATVALGKTYDPLTITRHNAMYKVSGYQAYRIDFTKPDSTVEIVVFTITPDNVGYIFKYNAPEDADFQTLMHSVNISSVAAAATTA